MKSKTRRGSLLVTIGLAVASLVYLFCFHVPGWKTVGQVRAQVRQKREYVLQTNSTLTAMLATQKEIDATRQFNLRSARQLPSVVEAPNVFAQIAEIAKASGATTSRFDPQPAVKLAKVSQVDVGLTLAGQPGQIYDFIHSLEALPLRIWIESLRIAGPSKDSENGSAEVGVVIFVDNSEISDYMKRAD